MLKGFSVEDSRWLNRHVYILEPVMVPLISIACVTDESILGRGNRVICIGSALNESESCGGSPVANWGAASRT